MIIWERVAKVETQESANHLGAHVASSHDLKGPTVADKRLGASGRGLQFFRFGPFKGRGQGDGRSERQRGAKMAAAAAAGPGALQAPSSLLLVVGGECGCSGLLAYVLEELERGRAGLGARGAGGGRGRASRPEGRVGVRPGCGQGGGGGRRDPGTGRLGPLHR